MRRAEVTAAGSSPPLRSAWPRTAVRFASPESPAAEPTFHAAQQRGDPVRFATRSVREPFARCCASRQPRAHGDTDHREHPHQLAAPRRAGASRTGFAKMIRVLPGGDGHCSERWDGTGSSSARGNGADRRGVIDVGETAVTMEIQLPAARPVSRAASRIGSRRRDDCCDQEVARFWREAKTLRSVRHVDVRNRRRHPMMGPRPSAIRAAPRAVACTATRTRRRHSCARRRPLADWLALGRVSAQQLRSTASRSKTPGRSPTDASNRSTPRYQPVSVGDRLEAITRPRPTRWLAKPCGAGSTTSSAASATHRRCPTATSIMGCYGPCSTVGRPAATGRGWRARPFGTVVDAGLAGAVFAVDRWTPYSLGKPLDEALATGLPAAARWTTSCRKSLVHLAQIGDAMFFPNAPPTMTGPSSRRWWTGPCARPPSSRSAS